MNKNMGSVDRILRILVGIALLVFAFAGPQTGYNWVGYIGVVPLLTALIGWCPAYTIFGIKTCKVSD